MLLSQVATPIGPGRSGASGRACADQGGVVSVSQAVEHRSCALGASVARIAHVSGKRNGSQSLELTGCGLGKQTDFPMAGMITEGNGRTIGFANSPWLLRIRTWAPSISFGLQPMPAFWLNPKRSPDGQFLSISGTRAVFRTVRPHGCGS